VLRVAEQLAQGVGYQIMMYLACAKAEISAELEKNFRDCDGES
jgi:hypothetical protein